MKKSKPYFCGLLFLIIKAVLPHMIEKNGRIINIASQLAQIGGVELAPSPIETDMVR